MHEARLQWWLQGVMMDLTTATPRNLVGQCIAVSITFIV
jgi:hypothetical protein